MKSKSCIVILSHSSYQDIWEITLKSFYRYLPKGIDVFITSDNNLSENTKKIVSDCDAKILSYPDEISWSKSLKYIVNNIYQNYDSIIFSFDDLVLLKEIDENKLFDVLASMNEMDYLILNDGHHNIVSDIKYRLLKKTKFFPMSSNDSYVGSLVFSTWNANFIHKIINNPKLENVNPWQYEFLVSKLMSENKEKGFFVLTEPLVEFSNVIVKGKIFKPELDKAIEFNKAAYSGNREYMNFKEQIKFDRYRKVFKKARYLIPHFLFKNLRQSYK